jgi:hypothetical protein
LAPKLRPANIDAAAGAPIQRLVDPQVLEPRAARHCQNRVGLGEEDLRFIVRTLTVGDGHHLYEDLLTCSKMPSTSFSAPTSMICNAGQRMNAAGRTGGVSP